jgi:alpha-D-ribose 1-methylphosphonate 5-triphosphate synthase subunit PhnH
VTTPQLADVPKGFAAPGPASQAVFRRALEALSRPGRCLALQPSETGALSPPAGVSLAMGALMLTLLDRETTLWLSPAFDRPLLRAWLAFHTGVQLAGQAAQARFIAARAAELDEDLWDRLGRGTDEMPQHGATLLLEVDALRAGAGLELSGPGIPRAQTLQVDGVSTAVWARRREEQARYPLGVDLLLCCGLTLAGLPRSTRIQHRG